MERSVFYYADIFRRGEVFEAGALECAEADSLQIAALSEGDMAQRDAAQEREWRERDSLRAAAVKDRRDPADERPL